MHSIVSRFTLDRSRTYRNSIFNPDPFGLAKEQAKPKKPRKPRTKSTEEKPPKPPKEKIRKDGRKMPDPLTPEQLQAALDRAPKEGISKLAREFGLPWTTLYYRLKKAGYRQEAIEWDASIYIKAFDEGYSISEISEILGVPASTIKWRMYSAGKTSNHRTAKQRREIRAKSNFVLAKQ